MTSYTDKHPRSVKDLKEFLKDIPDDYIVDVYEGEVVGITISDSEHPHAETHFLKTRILGNK